MKSCDIGRVLEKTSAWPESCGDGLVRKLDYFTPLFWRADGLRRLNPHTYITSSSMSSHTKRGVARRDYCTALRILGIYQHGLFQRSSASALSY